MLFRENHGLPKVTVGDQLSGKDLQSETGDLGDSLPPIFATLQ